MDPDYYDLCKRALNGSLASASGASGSGSLSITNGLNVSLTVFWLSPNADQWGFDKSGKPAPGAPGYRLDPGESLPLTQLVAKTYFVVTTLATGAFCGVAWWDTSPPIPPTNFLISSLLLLRPGEIGDIPASSSNRLIPGDGPRVLVGSGLASNKSPLTREQYWRLSPDSYSLQAHESRTVSTTTTSGMETTSSEASTFATALGMTASSSAQFGWGQVSAAISASLSYSASTFQQVTLNSQTVNFVSSAPAPPDRPTLVLMWQVCDVITVFDPTTGEPKAATVSALLPQIGVSSPLSAAQPRDDAPYLSLEETLRGAPVVAR